jgi:hypothetical protein
VRVRHALILTCAGVSNILTSISTSLQQSAENSSKSTQNENKTEEQRSAMSVMPAIYDRTQVEHVVHVFFFTIGWLNPV